MISLLIGLLIGIGACEIVGRHLSGYSVVMEAVEWLRSIG